jgi:hypothetical protein
MSTHEQCQALILTMSILIKAQVTPQLAWYTCRTSLGSDGMPEKLIEEDLRQPHQIKISFEEGSKDVKINLEKL